MKLQSQSGNQKDHGMWYGFSASLPCGPQFQGHRGYRRLLRTAMNRPLEWEWRTTMSMLWWRGNCPPAECVAYKHRKDRVFNSSSFLMVFGMLKRSRTYDMVSNFSCFCLKSFHINGLFQGCKCSDIWDFLLFVFLCGCVSHVCCMCVNGPLFKQSSSEALYFFSHQLLIKSAGLW